MEVNTESTGVSEASATSTESSTETSTVSTAPQVNTETSPAPTSASVESKQSLQAQAPVFAPNYKVKVGEKEHEMEEWIRSSIKDADSEKKARELYEKAYGLDDVKQRREEVQKRFQDYRTQVDPVMKHVGAAHQFYNEGKNAYESGNDVKGTYAIGEALKALGMDENLLKKFMFHKLTNADLPQEQKSAYNRHYQAESENMKLQQQMQEQSQYIQSIAVQAKTAELNQAISRPEVASIIQTFDQRNGHGSFQTEVIQRGQLHWSTRGVDMPADQLVQEIIQKYGLTAPQAQSQAQNSVVPANQTPPVIPVIKGSTTSPVEKSMNTVSDMKEYRKSKYGY